MATAFASRPSVSSPLARPAALDAAPTSVRPQAKRTLSLAPVQLPKSRPLRPFPSIANAFTPAASSGPQRKPTKIIEPSKNFKSEFVLNLTQLELARQD